MSIPLAAYLVSEHSKSLGEFLCRRLVRECLLRERTLVMTWNLKCGVDII